MKSYKIDHGNGVLISATAEQHRAWMRDQGHIVATAGAYGWMVRTACYGYNIGTADAPLYYETRAFDGYPYEAAFVEQYATRKEALEGFNRACEATFGTKVIPT